MRKRAGRLRHVGSGIVSHFAGNNYHDFRYTLMWRRGGRRHGGWAGQADGRASRLRLLLSGFECQQTKRKIHSENVCVTFTQS